MIEKLKKVKQVSFSNSPKAKMIVGTAVLAVGIITSATVANMRKTIVLSIDGNEEAFVTYKGTVKDVLQQKGVELAPKDKVQPLLESKVSENEFIELKRAIPIQITANGTRLTLETAEDTVGDMLDKELVTLREQGIEFDKDIDETSVSLDSEIEEGLNIQIVKVETKEVVEREAINFDTIVEKNENLDSSVEKVKSEGVNGEKEITYKVVYKDGVEYSRDIKSTKTISEPQNKVIEKGTGTIYASRSGESIKYKKKLKCEATAYTGDKTTATGRTPVRNPGGLSVIAVDPSVISLGSKVYVEGYGYAIAADTGGAIKGHIVDLYLNSKSECYKWGRRPVDVLVIAGPGEW